MIGARPAWPLALIALTALACGRGGPSRFAPEDHVVVQGRGKARAVAMDTAPGVGSLGDFEGVDNGTVADVVDDSAPDDPKDPGARKVRIKLLEGKSGGMSGTVRRDNLIPFTE